jgi:hypothetical protein
VDEVHDGPYCIFYAVDAHLQKRIAFQISDSAGKAKCLQFLRSLKDLKVRDVTTDGLGVYRHAVPEVFAAARHQVCLFHVLQELNESVLGVLAVFQMVLTGIVADLINTTRGVLEDVSYRLRRMELEEEQADHAPPP